MISGGLGKKLEPAAMGGARVRLAGATGQGSARSFSGESIGVVNGCNIVKSGGLVMRVHQETTLCTLLALGKPWRIRIDSAFPQPVHSMDADAGGCHVYKKVFSLRCGIGVNFM